MGMAGSPGHYNLLHEETRKGLLGGAGIGFNCGTAALPGAVIPAKAGIYSASRWKCAADGLDSRFRGNDQCFERGLIPNDTSTLAVEQFSADL
jgi:hypothetical protein